MPEIGFGSKEFWELYDKFCLPKNLSEFILGIDYFLVDHLRVILTKVCKNRSIDKLTRRERGWKGHKAWLILHDAKVKNSGVGNTTLMRCGDVVIALNLGKDLIITHSPIIQCSSGYILNTKWEPMKVILPLFDEETVRECIRLRLLKNKEEALLRMINEARNQGWY